MQTYCWELDSWHRRAPQVQQRPCALRNATRLFPCTFSFSVQKLDVRLNASTAKLPYRDENGHGARALFRSCILLRLTRNFDPTEHCNCNHSRAPIALRVRLSCGSHRSLRACLCALRPSRSLSTISESSFCPGCAALRRSHGTAMSHESGPMTASSL